MCTASAGASSPIQLATNDSSTKDTGTEVRRSNGNVPVV